MLNILPPALKVKGLNCADPVGDICIACNTPLTCYFGQTYSIKLPS